MQHIMTKESVKRLTKQEKVKEKGDLERKKTENIRKELKL
jgi:hypothetical protein